MRWSLNALLCVLIAPWIMAQSARAARIVDQPTSSAAATTAPAAGKDARAMTSAYDRVCKAQEAKRLSPKDAFILKARLSYAPASVPKDSEFSPRAGEPATREECGTGLLKELSQVFPKLSAEEKEQIQSLHFTLREAIRDEESRVKQGPAAAK